MCFLLTSAGAVMLELIAVHSLFAVSPFPARQARGALSAGVHALCSAPAMSAHLPCPDGGSLRHLQRLGTGQLSLSHLAPVLLPGLTTTMGSRICFQVKVFQRPGRAVGPPSESGAEMLGHPSACWLYRGTALQKPTTLLYLAESGLSPKGSSNPIKNSQGLRARPSADFLFSSVAPLLPACLVPSAVGLGSLTRGWAAVRRVMLCCVKCDLGTVTPTVRRLENGCCLLTALPSSYGGFYPRHRANT